MRVAVCGLALLLSSGIASAQTQAPGGSPEEPLAPLPPWPDGPPPAAPAPAPPQVAPEPPVKLPAPATQENLPDPWRFIIAGFGRFDTGMLPTPAVALSGGVGARIDRVRFDLEATFWFPQDAELGNTGTGGDLSVWTGSLSGCPLILREPIELGPCVGLEIGEMRFASFGVEPVSESGIVWSALLADAQATWVFAEPFAVRAELGMAIPFRRPAWGLDAMTVLDRPGVVSMRAQLGVEFHL